MGEFLAYSREIGRLCAANPEDGGPDFSDWLVSRGLAAALDAVPVLGLSEDELELTLQAVSREENRCVMEGLPSPILREVQAKLRQSLVAQREDSDG